MKRIGFIQLLVIASVMLASCASQAPEPVSYTVEMSEYAFSPDTIEAKVGQQVTLELTNAGALEHEIMIGRDTLVKDNRPAGYQTDLFAVTHVEPHVTMMDDMSGMDDSSGGAYHSGHSGFMIVLPEPGDKATLTFTVTKDMVGEWEIGCFSLEGVHYDAGMKGKFIVTQ